MSNTDVPQIRYIPTVLLGKNTPHEKTNVQHLVLQKQKVFQSGLIFFRL